MQKARMRVKRLYQVLADLQFINWSQTTERSYCPSVPPDVKHTSTHHEKINRRHEAPHGGSDQQQQLALWIQFTFFSIAQPCNQTITQSPPLTKEKASSKKERRIGTLAMYHRRSSKKRDRWVHPQLAGGRYAGVVDGHVQVTTRSLLWRVAAVGMGWEGCWKGAGPSGA
jgi:hypothetical protein